MIKTCSFIALMALLAAAQDATPSPSPAPAAPKRDEDLDKSAAKAAEWGSYTFSSTTKTTGSAKGDASSSAVVKYAKGSPWSIKSGDIEGFRAGESLATKEADGSWKRYEAPAPAKGKKGRKGGETGGPGALLAIKAPHEFLKDFGAKFKDVKREDGEGGRTYTGELTPEAAREFASAGMPKPGGKGPEITCSGSAKISVNVKTGEIVKIEVSTESKMTVKDKDIDLKRTSTWEISEVGTTKVEISDEAKKALSN